ncbi:MAG: metalloregulator ArsR/SmtB family transcription factor [Bacteroidales bacterium]|jgi:DNA-binding transcriptional ArsR family regulator|nr:metalloregulator ArsR/SmtB family transcription factor [Bacteroidales bacterium]
MGQAKTNLFDEQLTVNAKLFKALAHPARLQILKFLANTKSCITGDISDELPLKRTTVNQHIKELKEVGLIQGHIEGVKTKYCLNAEKVEELSNVLSLLITDLKVNNYKCE